MTTATAITKALLDPLLEKPGSARIEENLSNGITFVTVCPMTTDIRKVVGKMGANIRALQALVEYHGRIKGHNTRLILADAIPGPEHRTTERNPAFTPEHSVSMAQAYLRAIGQPDGIHPVRRADGRYVLAIAADLPEPIWNSFDRWITVVSMRHGGCASLEAYETAHA